MLLASLSILASLATASGYAIPVPDLFRPEPAFQFPLRTGRILPSEAVRFPIVVESIDTFELRVGPVAPEQIRIPDGSEDSYRGGDATDSVRVWPYKLRLVRPRDSGSTWTAWVDLDKVSKQLGGEFLRVRAIAGPRAFSPTTPASQCDSVWLEEIRLVSDLGVMGMTLGDDSLEIQTFDLERARPWAGVDLQRFDSSRVRVRTDSLGRVRVARHGGENIWLAKGGGANVRRAVLVAGTRSWSGQRLLEEGWSSEIEVPILGGESGQSTHSNGIRLFPYLARKTFRPGDTVVVGCLVRGPGGTIPVGRDMVLGMELPGGTTSDSIVRKVPSSGHLQWRWRVPESSPTGSAHLIATLGSETVRTSFKVEFTRIPRIRVASNSRFLPQGDSLAVEVSALWLTGRPAAGLDARVRIRIEPASDMRGAGYNSRYWPGPEKGFRSIDTVGSLVLGSDGRGVFGMKLPGLDRIGFGGSWRGGVSVYEDAGHATENTLATASRHWREGPGLKIAASDTVAIVHTGWFDLQDSLRQGRPLQLRLMLDTSTLLARNLPSGQDWSIPIGLVKRKLTDTSRFVAFRVVACAVGSSVCVSMDHSARTDYKGKFVWTRTWEGPENERFLVRDTAEHPDLSRRKLEENDTAQVRWESLSDGLALVQVVQGDRILRQDLKSVRRGPATWRAKTDSGWVPGVAVVVSELSRGEGSGKWLRAAGLRIDVEPAVRELAVSLAPDSVFHPLETAQVRVRNASGRKGTFVLSAVDQGILDLDDYRIPDPTQTFLEPEAMDVHWWDGTGRYFPYDALRSETCTTEPDVFLSRTRQGRMALGAGGSGNGVATRGKVAASLSRLRRDGRPLSWVSEILPLVPGEQTVRIPMPAYTGEVRVSAVAEAGFQTVRVDTQVKSRAEVELVVSLPRNVGPSDTAIGHVRAFGKPKSTGTLEWKAWGPLRMLDSAKRSVVFDSSGEARATVALAATGTGEGWLETRARQGASGMDLPVLLPATDERNLSTRVVSRRSTNGSLDLEIPQGFSDSGLTTRMEVATHGVVGLERRIRDLLLYPHGCLEQTVSTAFPQLLLGRLVPGLPRSTLDTARANVAFALEKIPSFKTGSGMFSLWPSGSIPDPLATMWAVRFLTEARSRGNSIDSRMVDDALTGLARERFADAVDEAARLDLLAGSGRRPDSAVLDSLGRRNLTREARWILAAAWEHLGAHDTALAQAERARRTPDTTLPARRGRMGSRLRDRALAMDAMVALGDARGRDSLVLVVLQALEKDSWLSTQEMGMCLSVLSRALPQIDTADHEKIQWRTAGGVWKDLPLDQGVGRVSIPGQPGGVEIRGGIKGRVLKAQVQRHGTSTGVVPRPEAGLSLEAALVPEAGSGPLAATMLEGTGFVLEIRVRNKTENHLTDIACTSWLPGGWTVRRDALSGARSAAANHVDIRDDRVVHHFGLAPAEEKIFRLPLAALQAGSYRGAKIEAEALYDAEIYAARDLGRVKILAR